MEENPKIELDTVTPASFAHLVERREDILLQHGGAVTRMYFDNVEVMNLDAFLQQEVPRLKKQQQTLTVIRDSVSKAVTLITGDQVLMYHLTNMEEVPVNELVKLIKVTSAKTFIPNIGYPIVSYVEKAAEKIITVLVENKSFIYRTDMFLSNNEEFSVKLYLPPIWFQVRLNGANTVIGMKLAAVPEKALTTEKTCLRLLPLPNIHANGELCLGYSVLKATYDTADEITEGMIIQSSLDQVFNSLWNFDLLDRELSSVVGRSYDTLKIKNKEIFDDIVKLRASDMCKAMQIRAVAVLTDPNGWKFLNMTKMSSKNRSLTEEQTVKRFLGVDR